MSNMRGGPADERSAPESKKKPMEFRRFERLTRQIIPRQPKPKKSKESRHK
ncbi:MAG: hypothetical protein M3167_16650 [Acidobacteriota bacterium]|nr:hypothetical protein [Acidobacteriota bacterium]